MREMLLVDDRETIDSSSRTGTGHLHADRGRFGRPRRQRRRERPWRGDSQ